MWKKVETRAVSGGAVIIFGVAVLFFLRNDAMQDLSIRFAGSTNSVAGVPIANFVISNAAPHVLFVSKTGTLQERQGHQWIDRRSTNVGVIALMPTETLVVSVAKPTNCEAWRIWMVSGKPRTSWMWRRIGNAYNKQPFQFEPLSYFLLAPVLRQNVTYSEQIRSSTTN